MSSTDATPTKTPALLPTREDRELYTVLLSLPETNRRRRAKGEPIVDGLDLIAAHRLRHSPAPDKGELNERVPALVEGLEELKTEGLLDFVRATPEAEKLRSFLATPAGDSEGLRAALEKAAGRLQWCATANPGCSSNEGKALAQAWADDALYDLATATPPEAVDAIPLAQPAGDAWKEAVLNELIVAHIYSAKHDNDPRLAIRDAIAWNVQVALDPAVSQAARDLQSGDAVLREALERIASRLPGVRAPHRFSFACDIARRALASPPVEGEG